MHIHSCSIQLRTWCACASVVLQKVNNLDNHTVRVTLTVSLIVNVFIQLWKLVSCICTERNTFLMLGISLFIFARCVIIFAFSCSVLWEVTAEGCFKVVSIKVYIVA